ncbi:hypothetical protein J1N35_040189 [Gossypium stocksii]|uniref:Retrovirus-related Pol polyprotein from transposon TNT 1-94 n=1 Tax=Gossypium stocksii TaxID=47602 RepID=A0A9D3UDC4_9ROSI|nr:hypothetical protein J1N35_040189 [Gossypium stocksii]
MSKTLISKLHMKQLLYAHRLEEGASVHEHLTVFKKILSNLEAIEVQYDKEDIGLILLCSLPPSYLTFKGTNLYSRESLTVDKVYDSLTSYDKMKHLVVKIDSHREGLIIRERQDQNADDDCRRTQEQNPLGKSKGRSKSSNRGMCLESAANIECPVGCLNVLLNEILLQLKGHTVSASEGFEKLRPTLASIFTQWLPQSVCSVRTTQGESRIHTSRRLLLYANNRGERAISWRLRNNKMFNAPTAAQSPNASLTCLKDSDLL